MSHKQRSIRSRKQIAQWNNYRLKGVINNLKNIKTTYHKKTLRFDVAIKSLESILKEQNKNA